MAANNEIREKAKRAGVKHWQIAIQLGVSEQTLVRWLRTPLDESKAQRITEAIDCLEAVSAGVA